MSSKIRLDPKVNCFCCGKTFTKSNISRHVRRKHPWLPLFVPARPRSRAQPAAYGRAPLELPLAAASEAGPAAALEVDMEFSLRASHGPGSLEPSSGGGIAVSGVDGPGSLEPSNGGGFAVSGIASATASSSAGPLHLLAAAAATSEELTRMESGDHEETGLCEVVMSNECASSRAAAGDASERDTYFEPHSPEIVMDMDIGGHRRRSNTSQRLDKLKKERKNAARVKHIIWQPNADPLPDADRDFVFEKKPIIVPEGPKTSLLTEHLNSLDLCDNPFTEYSKFDGRAHAGVPTRRINIFLTMAPPEELAFPMSVTVVASARVAELIGLICWQYTSEDREPPLRNSPELYSLHIAEDDGEVDWDFPPLDDRETVAKFGFNVLALVETEQTEVTVNVDPDGKDQVTLSLKKRNATVAEMLNAVVAQRPDLAPETGVELALERADLASTATSPLSADTRLSQLACQIFNLTKTAPGRKHKDAAVVEEPNFSGQMSAMEATVYQTFKVNMLSSLVIKAPIQLGISGDRVEIDPVQVRSSLNVSKFLSKPRAVTYQMDSVMECRLLDVKYGGRAVLRLVYLLPSEGGYKHHDLESDLGTAKEIVRKLQYILDFRSSMNRKTYLQQKEKRGLLGTLSSVK